MMTEDLRTRLALPLALMVGGALVTATLVGYVSLKSAQVDVGYRVHDLRARLVVLEQQRATLEVERAALARPQRLAHVARTTLGLEAPALATTAPLLPTSGGTP